MFYYKLPSTLMRPHRKEVLQLIKRIVLDYAIKNN
jgi:hypothetical protein